MSQRSTPRDYALANLCRLESLWSAVHDGDIEAVHDARVATRRIRAALPFVYIAPPAVADEVRRIGRTLGRVRELDATNALLDKLEPRVPAAAGAIGIARREVDDCLTQQRRRLIKKLRHRPRTIARANTSGSHLARLSSVWRSWRHELRDAIRHRATRVNDAVDRATAVYMPNRSHSARIALKKLRYLIEVAAVTGVMADAMLEDLRSAQEALGDLHDMTVLGRLIDETQFPGDVVEESRALAAVVASEVSRLHAKYVRHRDDIRRACDACLHRVEQQPLSALAIPAAAIVAVPMLASWYLQHNGAKEEVDRAPRFARATK